MASCLIITGGFVYCSFVLLPGHKTRVTPNPEAVFVVALSPQTDRLHVVSLKNEHYIPFCRVRHDRSAISKWEA